MQDNNLVALANYCASGYGGAMEPVKAFGLSPMLISKTWHKLQHLMFFIEDVEEDQTMETVNMSLDRLSL